MWAPERYNLKQTGQLAVGCDLTKLLLYNRESTKKKQCEFDWNNVNEEIAKLE